MFNWINCLSNIYHSASISCSVPHVSLVMWGGHVADLVTRLFLCNCNTSHALGSGPAMWRLSLLLVCFWLSPRSSFIKVPPHRVNWKPFFDQLMTMKMILMTSLKWQHWRGYRWLNTEQALLAGGIQCGKLFQLFQQLQANLSYHSYLSGSE